MAHICILVVPGDAPVVSGVTSQSINPHSQSQIHHNIPSPSTKIQFLAENRESVLFGICWGCQTKIFFYDKTLKMPPETEPPLTYKIPH